MLNNFRKRPNFNELINYIDNEQPIIKTPNRTATFLRNSPYLNKFDGNSFLDLEEQENDINREKMKEARIHQVTQTDNRRTGNVERILRRHEPPREDVEWPDELYDYIRPGTETGSRSYVGPGPPPRRYAPPRGGAAAAEDMYNIWTAEDEEDDAYRRARPIESYGGYEDEVNDAQERIDNLLDERDRMLEERAARIREMAQRNLQESHSPFNMGFLPTPDQPSAPPASVYSTPLAPRNLAEEFNPILKETLPNNLTGQFRFVKERSDNYLFFKINQIYNR